MDEPGGAEEPPEEREREGGGRHRAKGEPRLRSIKRRKLEF